MSNFLFKKSLGVVVLTCFIGVHAFFIVPYVVEAQAAPQQDYGEDAPPRDRQVPQQNSSEEPAEKTDLYSETPQEENPDRLGVNQTYTEEELRALQGDSQAEAAIKGVEKEKSAADSLTDQVAAQNAVQGVVTCSVGAMLANGLTSAFAAAAANIATEKTAEAVTALKEVPTNSKKANDDSRLITQKEVTMLKIFGFPILPGTDAIAYCLINTIIDYVAQSTIQWINSGFKGNPAFVDNPQQFFQDVADIEGGAFIEELTDGFMCEPFDINIQLGLLRHQLNTYGHKGYAGKCTLSEIVQNTEQFVNGDFNQGGWKGWFSLTQDPYNNPYEAYNNYKNVLDARVASRKNQLKIELDWGNGFLSFKDPETGKTTTPGKLIEARLNERLGSGERRIEMADEFDEIVTALVNQLVKVALNELLDERKEEDGGIQKYSPQNLNPLSPKNVLGS